jgi:CDP-diacylglycerol pyrophosphatase
MAAKSRPARGLLLGAALAMGALISLAIAAKPPAGSSALWHVVHDLCVTDMKVSGLPAPGVEVNLKGRFAVRKDLRGVTQLLLMPTDRIYGIESDRLLEDDSPNYWQDAWAARPLFDKGAGRAVPREDLGLAINSAYGRTQNQLHIHIDCLKPRVRDMLEADQRRIGLVWAPFPITFSGHRYRARRVMGENLGERDPFKLLAEDPRARIDMGRETLVVAGMMFAGDKPGFVLLSDRADLTRMDQGAGEELLDHSCAVLKEAPPPPPPAGKAN